MANLDTKSWDLVSDPTLFVDDNGGWNPSDAVISLDYVRRDDDRIGNSHRFDEAADTAHITSVHVHPNYLKSFLLVSLVELDEVGGRFLTGTTPGCPEVEEDHFPLEFGKSDLVIIEGFECEIRC